MINELVELRLNVLRKIPGFLDKKAMAKTLESYLELIFKYKVHEPHILRENGRLIAYIVGSRFFHRFYGAVLTQYVIDFDPDYQDQKKILNFLAEKLIPVASDNDFSLIEIYAPCASIIKPLTGTWKVAASTYGGFPKASLQCLSKLQFPKVSDFGCEIELATTMEQVDEIMALKLSAFKENPSLCWFWKCDQFQTQEYMRLVNSLSKQESFIVHNDGNLLGYAGVCVDSDNPYWGISSGVDLILNPKLQRKGLSYHLYEILLNHLVGHKVDFYKGATANPAVMKLIGKLDRWPVYYQLLPINFEL